MKTGLRRRVASGLAGLSGLAALAMSGCELEPETPSYHYETYNHGQGRDIFHVGAELGIVKKAGVSSTVLAEVYPNTPYTVTLECNNDGDSDRVAISIDGVSKGQYVTDENRMGGPGWYISQYAGPYHVTSTGNYMYLQVKVLSTDEWGVNPKQWNLAVEGPKPEE